MDDLKQKLRDAGLAGPNQADYKPGPGTRRLKYEDLAIWGNLLNGEWIKIPQITNDFLSACTKEPSSQSIRKYATKTGISPEMFSQLLELAIAQGFIEKSDKTQSGIGYYPEIGVHLIFFISCKSDAPCSVRNPCILFRILQNYLYLPIIPIVS